MTDAQLARIQAVSPRLHITCTPSNPYQKPDTLDPEVAEAEVLIAYHAYFAMEQAPRLKWLQASGDGVDHLRGKPIMQSDPCLTRLGVLYRRHGK